VASLLSRSALSAASGGTAAISPPVFEKERKRKLGGLQLRGIQHYYTTLQRSRSAINRNSHIYMSQRWVGSDNVASSRRLCNKMYRATPCTYVTLTLTGRQLIGEWNRDLPDISSTGCFEDVSSTNTHLFLARRGPCVVMAGLPYTCACRCLGPLAIIVVPNQSTVNGTPICSDPTK
jgi:hypothetical protein